MTSSGTVDIRARGDITSVEHFVSEVFRLRTEVSNRKLWYRGHSDIAYKLIPMVGRPLKYADKTKTLDSNGEIAMLHRFRRRAYPYAGRAMTAGEAIFLARHHGLPTRLLDWTANALFSLYFTCNEKLDKEGQVWAMHYAPDRMDVDAFELANRRTETELFDPPFVRSGSAPGPEHQSNKYAIKIIHPFYNSPRLLAQDGAFTMHSDASPPTVSPRATVRSASIAGPREHLYGRVAPSCPRMASSTDIGPAARSSPSPASRRGRLRPRARQGIAAAVDRALGPIARRAPPSDRGPRAARARRGELATGRRGSPLAVAAAGVIASQLLKPGQLRTSGSEEEVQCRSK